MEMQLPIIHEGKIDLCDAQDCNYACCEFASGNFIALYPKELATAHAGGLSTEHLEISSDGRGGHKAVCKAADRATCDGGYKPLDCRSYPFFPTVEPEQQLSIGLKGSKCPLLPAHLADHRAWVLAQWNNLYRAQPAVLRWLSQVQLVGYERDQA